MLIFHNSVLTVVEWQRAMIADGFGQGIVREPAVVKHNDIIYVSEHSVSNIQHHITNQMTPDYTPKKPIVEIHPNGMCQVLSRKKGQNKWIRLTALFDSTALTVFGHGSTVMLASMRLFNNDIKAALANAQKSIPGIPANPRITQYNLPVPELKPLEPNNIITLE